MKFGTWMSVMGILGGAWVSLAPYLIGFAPTHGNPWSGAVLGTVLLGALIMLASLVGLIAFWGLKLRELTLKHPKEKEA